MSEPGGNGNGLARAAVRVLLGVVGTLLLGWSTYVTAELRLLRSELTMATAEANSAHRRIDGVAVVLSRLCGPLPRPGEEGIP